MSTHPAFHNTQVVILGGTSGLGRALALQLHQAQARVLVVARHEEGLAKLQAEAPGILTLQGDIADKQQVYALAGSIQAQLPQIDTLFHVASTLGPTPLPLLLDTACEDLEQVLNTNVIGPFRLTKALIPGLLLRQQGTVVTISSDAAVNAYPHWGAYGISKAALDHMTRIFAAELQAQGLHFWAIDPGDMRTPMHFAAVPEADPEQLKDPAQAAAQLLTLLPRLRTGDPIRHSL